MSGNRIGTCSVDGCEKYGALVKTWCSMHYRRHRVNGDVNVTWPRVIWTCTIDGCGGDHCAFGYCTKHYQAFKTHGDALYVPTTMAQRGEIPHGTPHGYNHHKCRCAICLAWQRPYARAKMMEKKYGITSADYDRMWAEQDGRCAICLVECRAAAGGKWLAVDHCHDTGRVRGLLCASCNMGLGQLADDPDRVLSAAAYLIRNNVEAVA